jgi:hypothetical protein
MSIRRLKYGLVAKDRNVPSPTNVFWPEHRARDSGSPLARPHFATRRIGLKHRLV